MLGFAKGATGAGLITIGYGSSSAVAFTVSGTTLTAGTPVTLATNLGSAGYYSYRFK